MSTVLDCEICNKRIEKWNSEDFNYTDDGGGPFCDVCWFFIEHIRTLEERINDLERVTASLRSQPINPNRIILS